MSKENVRTGQYVVFALLLVSALSYWLAKSWTVHYVLLAPLILFPCIWVCVAKASNLRARLISGAVLTGFIVPALLVAI